jgi:hypothetical protein
MAQRYKSAKVQRLNGVINIIPPLKSLSRVALAEREGEGDVS